MTLPSSGVMTASMINVELGRAGTAPFDINGTPERTLAQKPSGTIKFSDFYGKSSGDPFYSSTNLLLHNDAIIPTNGIEDFSFANIDAALAPTGGALDSGTKKFGPCSIYFNGSAAGIVCGPGSSPYSRFDLNGTNWTWECWVNEIDGPTSGESIVSQRSASNGWVWTTSGVWGKFNGTFAAPQMSWTRPSIGSWHFMVWQKTGTTLDAYVDGIKVATLVGITSIENVGAGANIVFGSSSNAGANFLKGHLDEIRFTRGVARYTGNFTPPTAAFPNN